MKELPENDVTPSSSTAPFFNTSSPGNFFPATGTQQQASPNQGAVQTQTKGAGTTGATPTTIILQAGMVVSVEVRDQSGAIQPMSHNYPVSPDGTLHLPMIGSILAKGRTPTQLNADIMNALISGGFFQAPVVNVTSTGGTVDYSHRVAAGESIFVRVLGSDGKVEFEGVFPVDGNGVVHLPMAGDVQVLGQNFALIEGTIKSNVISKGFLQNPTVHVAGASL